MLFPRELRPGQQFTATELNELARQVDQSSRATGSGEMAVNQVGKYLMYRDLTNAPLLARITGSPTSTKYPWIEVVRNADGTTTDITEFPGRFGSATSNPAVELGGRTDVPTNAIVDLTILPGDVGWGFNYTGSMSISTQNVDGSDADATTTDIRANQATGIEFTTTGGYQRLDINPVTLAATFTYDITVAVPTCISIILTKTYASTTLGGQNVLTDVTASVAWKTKTVSMLHGTTVGSAGACVAPPSCCPSGAVSLSCGDGITYTTLTFSNKTLDCTCLPATGSYVAGTYPSGTLYAEWSTAGCPGNVAWELRCIDDVYLLYAGGVACTPVSAAPGVMVFDSPNLGANCGGAGGTVRATITA